MSSQPSLKGSSFTLSVLQLNNQDAEQAIEYLAAKIAQAPNFFRYAPLVVQLDGSEHQVDFDVLKRGIEALDMRVVGVTGWQHEALKAQIHGAGLATMQGGAATSQPTPSQAPSSHANKDAQTPARQSAMVVKTPVRSGQQIYARDRDLIVLGAVSNGAEVIADGSVQVYGALRGRAIAGAQGDTEAHIICHNLQAELCSIAGSYWLSDQIEPDYWQQPALISRSQDALQIETLQI